MNAIVRVVSAALLLAVSVPSSAQEGAVVPVQSQIINLSLVEALIAVKATDLAGVFGFIPEEQSSMAMADYLMHDHKALKLFVKKAEKDLSVAEGVNEWDKRVLLFLVGIDASGVLPPGIERVPKRWMERINSLSLAQSLPLQVIVQRREEKRK